MNETERIFENKRNEFIVEMNEFLSGFSFATNSLKLEFLFNKIISHQIALEQIIKYIEESGI